MLTLAAFAEKRGVSRERIRQLILDGYIPGARFEYLPGKKRGRWLIPEDAEVLSLEENRRTWKEVGAKINTERASWLCLHTHKELPDSLPETDDRSFKGWYCLYSRKGAPFNARAIGVHPDHRRVAAEVLKSAIEL